MSSPKVGDVLTTAEQLDACPEGTIVRYSDFRIFVFWIFVRRDDGEWEVTGARHSRTSDEVFDAVDEVTVIWLPPITRIEWETVVRNGSADLPLEGARWLDPFNGERVRVTVERIGDDDE